MSNRSLEQKLRRDVAKLRCRLCKSRARNWSYDNQLGYMIIMNDTNAVVLGDRYDLSIEDVQEFIDR